MTRPQAIAPILALLALTCWAVACGDGTTDPPPPPDPPRATTLTVTPATASLTAVGATVRLAARVLDQNGQPMAGAAVPWSSGDASVATVDASGLVTAAGNGTATITATAGSASGSAAVTVTQQVIAVAITPPADTLVAFGDTMRFAAEATDANGHAVAGIEFTWESGDMAVAAVDASGLVTAVGNGTATMTAAAGGLSDTATVTVAQMVAEVVVTPTADTLVIGDTIRLSAEARDANGHGVAGSEFTWESGDTAVATVDASGLVTSVGIGNAAITATSSGVAGATHLRVRGFILSGTVRDARVRERLAIHGAVVRLEDGTREPVTTDREGRYRLSDVAGQVRVTVTVVPSFVAQTAEVTVDSDRTLDFALEHTGEVPYQGTVWVTPDILGPADPTSLTSVTFTGRGTREVFDRRVDDWLYVHAFLFEARYGDRVVEFQVNPEFGTREAARAQVDVFAPAIGRLPAVLLSNLREVEMNAGEGLFGGNFHNGSFLIHTDDKSTEYAVREGYLEEIFLHEGGHVSLDREHAHSPGWRAAQRADGVSISEYARNFPDREDVAESILPYFAVRYRPHRLPAAAAWFFRVTIPNRLAYFDDQQLDMSPYTPAGHIAQMLVPETMRSLPRVWRRFEDPPIGRRR